ncbi:MAG: class I SAM-dependent methyltransferase [Fervidicoccaceae archaeon]
MNPREIMKKYDSTAIGYDDLYQEEQSLKYLASWKFLQNFEGNFIDIGCGTLLLERFLHAYGIVRRLNYIVGLDISEKMLMVGLSKISSFLELLNKTDLVRGDASRLPFRDESFDYGTSFTVFTLLPSENIGILEMERILRKSGIYSLLKKRQQWKWKREHEVIAETDKDIIYKIEKSYLNEDLKHVNSNEKINDSS